jgi:hypothetical protein
MIDRQAVQVAEAEWVAKEILAAMETGINVKRSKWSRRSKLN